MIANLCKAYQNLDTILTPKTKKPPQLNGKALSVIRQGRHKSTLYGFISTQDVNPVN